jgi:Ni/Fe-hydrogenase subunit HybB-like protein
MAYEIATAPAQTPPAALAAIPQPTKPPPWLNLIALDLLFSELACGLFVVGAMGDLIAPAVFGTMARVAYLLAFPIAVADLLCLVADLGDPLRFHHMLRVCNLKSPMSTGMWVINIFIPLAFICFILAAIDFPVLREPRAIVAGVALAPALFVGGYKGVMLSATAQPGWREARWLGAELVTSAVLMGVAGLMLVALFLPTEAALPGLRLVQIVLLFVNLALTLHFVISAARPLLLSRPPALAVAAVTLVIGWIAPLVLSFVGGTAMLAAAACLVIIGAAIFRRELVMMPHRMA